MSVKSCLYTGRVMHQRFTGSQYRFEYRVFSLLIDLDEFAEGFPGLRWLSANRFNLFSIYDRDFGPRDGQPLKDWITRITAEQGIDISGGKVWLSAYPRVLGYQFNPIAVWYCYNHKGELVAINAEVSNTFGEHHHYLLHENGAPLTLPYRTFADKVFHVSPFINMNMRYYFRFSQPGTQLALAIRETERLDAGEKLTLVATHTARAQPLSDRRLWQQALSIPLLGIKVITLIHWQALKIWLKGGRFHKSPPLPEQEISSCPTPKHDR
ncbi:MAG TPA: DUF1365 domain-containing protein [Halothiobacillaceae bacterium]|nr:DUF1365 domain-containing protein [Halothiobacillaceae bacterium]